MADIWGPWIEHDGNCVPVRYGQEFEAAFSCGRRFAHVWAPSDDPGSWLWRPPHSRVLFYRIRKPRGLTILQEIAADPQPVKESERVE